MIRFLMQIFLILSLTVSPSLANHDYQHPAESSHAHVQKPSKDSGNQLGALGHLECVHVHFAYCRDDEIAFYTPRAVSAAPVLFTPATPRTFQPGLLLDPPTV